MSDSTVAFVYLSSADACAASMQHSHRAVACIPLLGPTMGMRFKVIVMLEKPGEAESEAQSKMELQAYADLHCRLAPGGSLINAWEMWP